jgi:hypothetical protein
MSITRSATQGQYAVKIVLEDPDPLKFPIGAQGIAAIYTGGEHGTWAALRKISIRSLVVQLALSDQISDPREGPAMPVIAIENRDGRRA